MNQAGQDSLTHLESGLVWGRRSQVASVTGQASGLEAKVICCVLESRQDSQVWIGTAFFLVESRLQGPVFLLR